MIADAAWATPEYVGAYLRLLEAVSWYRRSTELAAFWPIRGRRYAEGGLLVVGRATNGWGPSALRPHDLGTPGARLNAVDVARRDSESRPGFERSWGQRSAFQRVARRVLTNVLGLGKLGEEESHMAWSNLYKVAPHVGGNPAATLRRLQGEAAPELLRLEVDALRPGLVLVLSGADWFAPFASALGLTVERRGGLVEGVVRGDRTWVVAKHPRSKAEGLMVDQVRAALGDGAA